MTTYQGCLLTVGLAALSVLVVMVPPLGLAAGIFIGLVTAVLLYRIGSSLQMGFNEHIKAMQAIYEEIGRMNRGVGVGLPRNPARESE